MHINVPFGRHLFGPRLRAGTLLLASLLVTGCVSPRLYPTEWPSRVDRSDGPCLSIAGAYRAASDPWPGLGETCSSSTVENFSEDNFSCVSLPYILGNWAFPAAGEVVKIVQTDETIAFTTLEKSMDTELQRGRDYRCAGNRIELTPPERNESWNIGGGIDAKRWALYRGEDGSLLAEYTEKAAGFIICPPMPVAVYANRWVRWQSVAMEESGADSR